MRPSTPPSLKYLLPLLALATLFIFRIEFLLRSEAANSLTPYAGRMAVVEGVVSGDPDVRVASVRVTVSAQKLNGKQVAGTALAVLPQGTQLAHGDLITVRGLLEVPEAFETDMGRAFDYPNYLRARGISVLMQRAVLVESGEGAWSVPRALYALKHTFERSLERVIVEPRAALLEGLLLGEKRGLPEALTQAFIISGLIHVVVLSGYNIGVVSEWALRLFGLFFRRRIALALGAGVIVLFAVMAGGGAATVRACLMGLIAVMARYLQRPALALRALFIAGSAMLLWNPLALYDPGFVLSMVATFGLITLSPAVERRLTRVPERGGIRSVAATTIAVQLFILPALLYYTGILSFVAVPANVLALPAVPVTMLFGFVAGLSALIHPLVAALPALAADLLLRFMLAVAQGAASLPFASTTVAAFPLWVVAAAYMPLTALAVWLYRTTVPLPQTALRT